MNDGDNALVPIEHLGTLVHHHDTLGSEPPSIDDIMRLTNVISADANAAHEGGMTIARSTA